MSTPPSAVRFVTIEWDRGHESFDAVVCADGPTGMIVQPLHDLVPIGALRWIRRDEILDIENLDPSNPAVRVADVRGFRPDSVDHELVVLSNLMRWGQEHAVLFLFYQGRTGSQTGLVGPIVAIDDRSVTFQDVDTNGVLTPETNTVPLDDIISVEWSTPYLAALADLVEHGEVAVGDPG